MAGPGRPGPGQLWQGQAGLGQGRPAQAGLGWPKQDIFLHGYGFLTTAVLLVSYAAILRVVMQRSSPLMAAHASATFLSLCYREPIKCMSLLAAMLIIFLVIFAAKSKHNKK